MVRRGNRAGPNPGCVGPTGISPEGTPEYWQVKNVGADQAGHIQQLMVENPDVNFALNSEV